MSDVRCSLVWKAAALEDGRLDGSDRASFEDHASRCADCRAEQKALAALYARVRELPSGEVSPFAHARQRADLLARANARFVTPRRNRRVAVAVAVGALAITTLAAGAIVTRRASVAIRATAPITTSAPEANAIEEVEEGPPRYEVHADEHAMWRARVEGTTARIDLADGKASFRVEPPRDHARLLGDAEGQRVFVSLPDGEVEAAGAKFSIDVALGRTRSVSVEEGHIVVRRRDDSALTLNAGEGWSRSQPTAANDDRNAPSTAAEVASSSTGRRPVAADRPSASGAVAMHADDPAALRRPPMLAAPGAKFDEAIGSFVRGSYAQADVELRDFMRDFPGDARCEDAAFLSAVARFRLGDGPGARTRAASYLSAYPAGLRRSEAQHILDSAR